MPDFTFLGSVIVDKAEYPVRFSTVELLYAKPELRKAFPSIQELTEYCMSKWGDLSAPNLTSAEKYAAKASISSRSSEEKLIVDCPIRYCLTREHIGDTEIFPYQLVNLKGMKILSPLEILYIGKSNDDTWDRIYNHNKWGLVEEHRNESEDLLVYFLEIETSKLVETMSKNSVPIITRDKSELSIESATSATEAALINYFIKEKRFNIEHVGSDLSKTKSIVDNVKSLGYDRIIVESNLVGPFGKLGTSATGYKWAHKAVYEL